MTTSRPPHKLTLDILESAFLGSEFFPLRMTRSDGEVIDATKDGVSYATVRIVGNALIVQQVGKGKRAEARAARVSQMLKAQKAEAEAPKLKLWLLYLGEGIRRGTPDTAFVFAKDEATARRLASEAPGVTSPRMWLEEANCKPYTDTSEHVVVHYEARFLPENLAREG